MRKFASMTLEELGKELEAIQAEAKELAEAESAGDISAEDLEHLENLYAESDEVKRVMAIKQRIADERAPRPRRAVPGDASGRRQVEPATPRRRVEVQHATPRNPADERTHGFHSLGHFAQSVGLAVRRRDEASLNHLQAAATTYSTESTGADGGWLVPPEFSDAVWKKISGVGSLLPLCTPFRTSRNSLSFPKDETTPWDNSAGITVYWEGEGGSGTEAKTKFEVETARLNKLMSLIKVTEELLEDAAGLDSYLRLWAPVKMASRINTAIVRGNGVGKPLGLLNAASLITVSKETSQDAATIIYSNVNKMWSRLYSECRANAVWLVNQECEPMLNGMAFVPAAFQPGGSTTSLTAYTPVYLPAGSIAGTPYGSIFGRPVVPMQPCSALGTIGDIVLADFSQYMALTKTTDNGAPRVDTSIHLHFDQAIDTYRFIFRMTGQPLWSATISPENGSTTYSWAVALETRS